jgi:hypothetical protein
MSFVCPQCGARAATTGGYEGDAQECVQCGSAMTPLPDEGLGLSRAARGLRFWLLLGGLSAVAWLAYRAIQAE